jgi:predicted nucleotidyltransferase
MKTPEFRSDPHCLIYAGTDIKKELIRIEGKQDSNIVIRRRRGYIWRKSMSLSQKKIMAIVRKYREKSREIFGDQFEKVIVYGSFARNEAHRSSDIDILVVLRAPFDYMEAIRKSSELTAKLSIEHDVVISRIFASNDDIQRRNLPFFINVRREGVLA